MPVHVLKHRHAGAHSATSKSGRCGSSSGTGFSHGCSACWIFASETCQMSAQLRAASSQALNGLMTSP
eukprot:10821167-Karenia_brevis.AAC.1